MVALYTQTKTPCLLTLDLARACPVLTLRQASCLSLSQTSAETGIPASKKRRNQGNIWWYMIIRNHRIQHKSTKTNIENYMFKIKYQRSIKQKCGTNFRWDDHPPIIKHGNLHASLWWCHPLIGKFDPPMIGAGGYLILVQNPTNHGLTWTLEIRSFDLWHPYNPNMGWPCPKSRT